MFHDTGKSILVLTDHRNQKSSGKENALDRQLPFMVLRIPRFKPVFLTYCSRIIKAVQILLKYQTSTIIVSGRFPIWLGALLSLVFRRRRYAAILHGSELHVNNPFLQWFTRWGLQRFETLIAVSNFTASLAKPLVGRKSICIIPNGFAPLSLTPNKNVPKLTGNPALITVGSVSRRKGQHNVIKALPLILQSFPEAHYHIVGIPAERTALEQLVDKLGVEKHVTFHGAVSQESLPVLLAGADVFIMLSERLPNGDVEGFGIAILEANDLGLPAIGASGCGIEDAIHDGYSGRLVHAHNPKDITAALQDIMARYAQYSSSAVSWSRQFVWDMVREKYLKIFTN